MIVSINQPAYLPWLGYFARIAQSDLHLVLDHVQFEKNSFTNRNKLRQPQGWSWVTVPLRTGGKFGELAIRSIETASDQPWRRKHWQTIRANYAKAPFFREHAEYLEALYAREWPALAPLLAELTGYLLRQLAIETPLRSTSEMKAEGAKAELVLNLCREAGADTYLSGPLGRDYLDLKDFAEAGIRLLFQDYVHPTYAQAFPGFEPYMAALDLLLNHGGASRAILIEGARTAEQ